MSLTFMEYKNIKLRYRINHRLWSIVHLKHVCSDIIRLVIRHINEIYETNRNKIEITAHNNLKFYILEHKKDLIMVNPNDYLTFDSKTYSVCWQRE